MTDNDKNTQSKTTEDIVEQNCSDGYVNVNRNRSQTTGSNVQTLEQRQRSYRATRHNDNYQSLEKFLQKEQHNIMATARDRRDKFVTYHAFSCDDSHKVRYPAWD